MHGLRGLSDGVIDSEHSGLDFVACGDVHGFEGLDNRETDSKH